MHRRTFPLHLCSPPTREVCNQASLPGAIPEVPGMMASPASAVTWALTPACPAQVFSTSPEEHAEAVERVKKAKVRLLPTQADTDLPQCPWPGVKG